MSFLDDSVVLVTDGIGLFCKKFVETILKENKSEKIIICNDLQQHEICQFIVPFENCHAYDWHTIEL